MPRKQNLTALFFVAPFVIAYLVIFIYPTLQMAQLSLTDAPLIGDGKWVGFKNYIRLWNDAQLWRSALNTGYFVLLTVIPTTIVGLMLALMVNRLNGWFQSIILACFFLPYILPVSVVILVWQWLLDTQFGVAQGLIKLFTGKTVSVFRDRYWAMPMVALITIWWTNGFNLLLFIAGLRNISQDYYDAAALDGAGRWQQFRYITLPLLWPVTALVLTIQLILQLKIFDQVYLLTQGGPANATYVMVQYIYKQAFQLNKGGYAATVALALFAFIVILSVLQYQVLRSRGQK